MSADRPMGYWTRRFEFALAALGGCVAAVAVIVWYVS